MTRDRILLEFRDVAVGKTREVIEILVIFPHVINTEAEIFTFAHASDRRAMRAWLVAPSHWQQGPEALASAVFLGLMRILSKNFEFVVIESNYADYELLNKN